MHCPEKEPASLGKNLAKIDQWGVSRGERETHTDTRRGREGTREREYAKTSTREGGNGERDNGRLGVKSERSCLL